jgi:hypothetical protein
LETFKSFESKLYGINDGSFEDIALEVFHYQAVNNPVYASYIRNLRLEVSAVESIQAIPFLPISFFKTHAVKTGDWVAQLTFSSSGTTGQATSSHPVRSLEFYQRHARRNFEYFFGSSHEYHFCALLPSYLERKGSSLIAMMDHLLQSSDSPFSTYYLGDTEALLATVARLKDDSRKVILWGVTFALLDLSERGQYDLSHCMIFETGGMKGRRKEITRSELHEILKKQLNVNRIYSEYGMTELFSQAYTVGELRFKSPPWLKILGRDLTDPFTTGLLDETAGINVIDLANWDSISFIETEDLGKVYADGSFEVLGRIDNSDIRGCSLMV